MNIRWNLVVIGLVGAALGFLLQGHAPLGSLLWPPEEGGIQPEGAALTLLMSWGIVEAIAFGVGVAFLVAAWPWVKARSAGALTWPVYLATAWLFLNWPVHTGLHMNVGNITTQGDYLGLAAIEWGFHGTLIASGLVFAMYMMRSVVVTTRSATADSEARPARKAT
jgi:hypothetical protein